MLKLPSNFAHEVYVLPGKEIAADKAEAKLNPWQALNSAHNLKLFIIYGVMIGGSLAVALYLKSKPFFQRIGKAIDKCTYFAPDIIRISLGLSLLFAAHFKSVFGPELPVNLFAGGTILQYFLYIVGAILVLGIFTRAAGALVAVFWILALLDQGWYMLSYINYFGEGLALALIARQNISLDRFIFKAKKKISRMERWSMPVARITFGLALLYAAINVKFVTAHLSLDVVNQYHLTRYFPFDPLFVVLGAGLVEIMIAILFMVGLLQRVNSLMFLVFITLSLIYFKEAVWPHYFLIGLAAGIFFHKPDHLTLDARLFRRR